MSFLDKKVLLKANLETRSITEEKQSEILFYNTDENIANLYMKLIYVSDDGLSKELQKDEVSGYSLKLTAIKPKTNQIREVDGVLSEDLNNEETCAIFKFQLGTEFTNQIGSVICCTKITKDTQKLNMNHFVYTIKADKLTGLNAEIESNPDLPVLKGLIEEVKETAQTVNNIDNVNVSDIKTYSNKKIEEKFSGVSSQIKDNVKDIDSLNNVKANVETVVSNLYNTEGIINQILDVCQSYTDNFDKFVYGNKYTAWDKTVQTVNGKYELDCSSFQNLLIHGVKFQNSRYNGKDDNYGSPLFFHNIDSYKHRLANQIAKYCVENGYSFIPKSLDEIRAGDLVFYSWKDFDTNPEKYTQAQIDFHNNAFMKIDHIAMYLDKKNDMIHQTIQYEKNTPQFLFDVDNEYMNQTVLVARLPFANVENYDSKNIIVNGNKKQTCTNAITIGKYYLNKSLEKGKMYSMCINGQISTQDCYYIIQANSQTIHSDFGRGTTNGTVLFYFLYQGDSTNEITISIGSSNTENTQRNGHVNWCALNEGYRIISNKTQNTGVFNAREIPLTDFIKGKIVDGFAFTNNLVETETHFNLSLNLPVNEDFISNTIEIGDLGFNISKTQRIPCTLVSNTNVSCNGVLQIGWDGKVKIIKFDSSATWRHATASGIIVK